MPAKKKASVSRRLPANKPSCRYDAHDLLKKNFVRYINNKNGFDAPDLPSFFQFWFQSNPGRPFTNLKYELLYDANKHGDVVEKLSDFFMILIEELGPYMVRCPGRMHRRLAHFMCHDLGITPCPGGPGGTPLYCPALRRFYDPDQEECPDFQ